MNKEINGSKQIKFRGRLNCMPTIHAKQAQRGTGEKKNLSHSLILKLNQSIENVT